MAGGQRQIAAPGMRRAGDEQNAFALGVAAAKSGDIARALALFEIAAKRNPRRIEPVLSAARALDSVGRLDEAEARYQRVLALAPENVPALLGLARISEKRGDLQSAIGYLQEAHRFAPAQTNIAIQLGALFVRQSHLLEARKMYEAVLEREPENIRALVAMGNLARNGHAWLEAHRLFKVASNAAPDRLDLRMQLGKCCCELMRLDEAEQIFSAIRVVDIDHPEAIAGLGEVARLRGDVATALAHLEDASGRAPNNMEIKKSLRKIKRTGADYDWHSEIQDALLVAQTSDAPPAAQLAAANILVQYGMTEAARPLLERIKDKSRGARQLLVAAREIERIGVAQGLSGYDGQSSDADLDALRGYHAMPATDSDTLLIVFAGQNMRAWMTFSVLNRILRSMSINVIYVRDLHEMAYARGVVGLGDDYDSTVTGFRQLADRYGAKRILALGNCFGCLGALRFGLSLGAQGVLGIAPVLYAGAISQGRIATLATEIKKILPIDHKNMHTRYLESESPPNVALVYSALCERDAESARLMADVPCAKIAGLPNAATHDTVKDLLIRGLLLPLLREFVATGEVSQSLMDQIATSSDR